MDKEKNYEFATLFIEEISDFFHPSEIEVKNTYSEKPYRPNPFIGREVGKVIVIHRESGIQASCDANFKDCDRFHNDHLKRSFAILRLLKKLQNHNQNK